MTKRYSALLTTLFASLMLSQAPAQANGLDDIVARGTLKVAVPQDFPPFGSVGPDMKPRGLDIDTAKLLADQLKVKLELTPVNSTNRIPFLTTGKVDLVISSLGKNPERAKVIDFSNAYAPFYLAVFGPPDAAIVSLDDLKGKTISVTRGAIEDIELTAVAPKEATIKRFEDNNSTIAAYLAGQVDLIASGNVVMVAISERNPKRVPALKVKLKDSPVYVGVNKNEPALLERSTRSWWQPRLTAAWEKRDAVAQRTAACRPLTRSSKMAYQFDFVPVLANTDLLLRGALFTTDGHWRHPRRGPGHCRRGSTGVEDPAVCMVLWSVCRVDPQHAVPGATVFIFFGLPSLGLKITEWQAAVLAMVINLGRTPPRSSVRASRPSHAGNWRRPRRWQ